MELNRYRKAVEKHRDEILAVEKHIFDHPESGFREWETTKYLEAIFEKAGYELKRAGNIPGFYTDLETGKPGPKVLIMGELDALVCPNHFHAVNGCAHACGHNAQCAGLVGVALALKEPGVLEGLCGSVRLMAVPAEEMIETEFRTGLRKQGIIHFLSGKAEFIYRGYMDGVDIAYMLHSATKKQYMVYCPEGYDGIIAKEAYYEGVAAHASTAPHQAVNALYAATQGLNAINALRETFREEDLVRVHPIMEEGGHVVNIIPSRARLNMCVRAANMDAIWSTEKKVNRALASGALALGARVKIVNSCIYTPMNHSGELMGIAEQVFSELFGQDKVNFHLPRTSGSTDAGEVCSLLPTLHANVSGATGKAHGDDWYISNPENACVQSAVAQTALLAVLLSDDAKKARLVIENYRPEYASKEEYIAAIDKLMTEKELVTYTGDGRAEITF